MIENILRILSCSNVLRPFVISWWLPSILHFLDVCQTLRNTYDQSLLKFKKFSWSVPLPRIQTFHLAQVEKKSKLPVKMTHSCFENSFKYFHRMKITFQ